MSTVEGDGAAREHRHAIQTRNQQSSSRTLIWEQTPINQKQTVQRKSYQTYFYSVFRSLVLKTCSLSMTEEVYIPSQLTVLHEKCEQRKIRNLGSSISQATYVHINRSKSAFASSTLHYQSCSWIRFESNVLSCVL